MGFKANDPAILAAMEKGLIPKPVAAPKKRNPVPRPVKLAASSFRFELVVPLKLINPLNRREHWIARQKRVRKEREEVGFAFDLYLSFWRPPAFRYAVRLIRLGNRKWDDDGTVAGLKGVRDEVAVHLGVDDGSDQIKFTYGWEPGKFIGVRIVIEEGESS